MAQWTYINNEMVPESDAKLHFRDLAFSRGYGAFDFLRVKEGYPLFVKEHLGRLMSSAQQLRLPLPPLTELAKKLQALIEKNELKEGGIRLTITGGYSQDGYTPSDPNLVISVHTFQPPSSEQEKKGIVLISHEYQRQLPHIKSIDYLTPIWLQPMLREKQGDDLLYHFKGKISECPRSNFFVVTRNRTILTPADGMLPGITRQRVLRLAGKKFTTAESTINREDIFNAEEAFITSTTRGILPVCRIDDHPINTGPVTLELRALLEADTRSYVSEQK